MRSGKRSTKTLEPAKTKSRARSIGKRLDSPNVHAIIEECAREDRSPADDVDAVIRQVKAILVMAVEGQVEIVTRKAAVTRPFRFFDLPAELWSRIGKLVIQNTDTCEEDNLNLPNTIPGVSRNTSAVGARTFSSLPSRAPAESFVPSFCLCSTRPRSRCLRSHARRNAPSGWAGGCMP
ncbi:hypothetical protein DOTSEDRAFT_69965 [Dothistroma septosporum NZE10]|uniref:Uncharacterized protein n=1 Tax=Dothistroma septosporum (strain NZE10 / CBS 128990) TaxID=675120 RepID=N1Q0P3_DOTSN|nr:hypothetical protein DOTSEDRAFT_69965 [Dothistroma septosporum NZE10]